MSVESGDERGGGWSKCRDGPVVAAPPGWGNPCPEEVAGQMESPHARRILIVANRTAAKPRLPAEVGARAARGPCRFTLLVPRPFWDPDTEEAAITLELALPLLDEAAGGQVDGIIGDTDPFVAVRETRERERFDEVIASTLPTHVSHWLRLDLPARVKRLGLPGHGGHGQTDRPPAHPLVLGLNVLEFVEKKHNSADSTLRTGASEAGLDRDPRGERGRPPGCGRPRVPSWA